MNTVSIFYLLSEKAQRELILSGGNGAQKQEIITPVTDELMKYAHVDKDGNAKIYIGFEISWWTGEDKGVDLSKKIKTPAKILNEEIISIVGINDSDEYLWDVENNIHYFECKQTVESLIEWEENRVKTLLDTDNNYENITNITNLKFSYKKYKKREMIFDLLKMATILASVSIICFIIITKL